MTENLSVSWDEYQKNICRGLSALQQRGEFVDMTLAAEGHHVKVHQMVLSLVSPFIKELISAAKCPHPIIFLNRVSFETMQAILEYAYTGEVIVRKDIMGEFLEACKDLHIKGLENMLKDAQSTVKDIFSEPNESNSRKRKKNQHDLVCEKESFEEKNHYDDDFQNDVYDEQVETSLPKREKESMDLMEHTANDTGKKTAALQYSVSCQGNLQIVLNRYMYAFRHIRKNEERFWRCINQQKSGCPAIVTTLQDKIKQRSFPHNHPFHDAQILKRTRNGNIFTSVTEGEIAAVEKKRQKADTDLLKLL